jgi:arylsulfatase A-like enzyme
MESVGLNDHGAHRTNQLAQDWIRKNKGQAFYMFIHYIEPHNPIDAPYPYKNKYWKNRSGQGIDKDKLYLVAQNPLICFTNNITLNNEELTALRALYDGEINYLDHKIGELIAFLKKERIYDDTFIIITADHGEHFGEKGLYSHVASLYEPIIHIPLMMKYPERFNKRGRISGLVQLVDIFPTVIETTGLNQEFLKGVQGKSLFATDSDPKYHEYIIAEWEGRIPEFVSERIRDLDEDPIVKKFRETMVMIREGNYKYILKSKGGEELYDLENDKREENNILEREKEVGRGLRQKVTQWQSSKREFKYEKQSSIDEITKKNLESLGYI